MDLASRMLRAMTGPTPADAEEFRTWYAQMRRVSDADLGGLLPAAYGLGRAPDHVSTCVRFMVEEEVKQRQPAALARCQGAWPDAAGGYKPVVTAAGKAGPTSSSSNWSHSPTVSTT